MKTGRHFRLSGHLLELAREHEKAHKQWHETVAAYADANGAEDAVAVGQPYRSVVGLAGCTVVPKGWKIQGKNKGGPKMADGTLVVVPDRRTTLGRDAAAKLSKLNQPTPSELLHAAKLPDFVFVGGNRIVWTTVGKLGKDYFVKMGRSSSDNGNNKPLHENMEELRLSEWARLVEDQEDADQAAKKKRRR